MKNNNLTNEFYKKVPHVIILCPCILLLGYIKNCTYKLTHHNTCQCFTNISNYIQNNKTEILPIIFYSLFVTIALYYSSKSLFKKFKQETFKGKLISMFLISINIILISIVFFINKDLFKLLFTLCMLILLSSSTFEKIFINNNIKKS